MITFAHTRLPMRGEEWRHYKGDLYQIVGNGYDEATGKAVIVYQPAGWSLVQAPALWVRTVDDFMAMSPE